MIDKLEGIKDRFEEVGQLIVQPEAMADMKQFSKLSKEYKDLEPVIRAYEEYKNHFEKDRALSRRFEKIEVAEPLEGARRPGHFRGGSRAPPPRGRAPGSVP